MRISFSEITTLRVGGDAAEYLAIDKTDDLVSQVRDADREGTPLLVIGQGSNILVGDGGFDGLVIGVRTPAIGRNGECVDVDAGATWDQVVEFTVDEGLGGLEPISGVPGTAGGTPVQNVGAFGAEVATFMSHVTVYDRFQKEIRQIAAADCGFGGHRTSVFKRSHRYVILRVHFSLPRTRVSQPIGYAGLADRLGVALGQTASVRAVREAVLELRRERAMVLDQSNHDTWSVGSFFVNPVLQHVPPQAIGCPQYADINGIKIAAAWLIQRAGFAPGYGAAWGRGRVRLSTKHTLAITNRGGATASEVVAFATHIREGVHERFGVWLEPECDLINCSLPRPDRPLDAVKSEASSSSRLAPK